MCCLSDHGLLPNLRFVATIEVNISDINEAPTNIALDYDKVIEREIIRLNVRTEV